MERYESYKDSGVEWVGDIPLGWDIKKIKHNCYVKARVGWKGLNSSEFLTEGYAFLITGTDFKKDEIDWKNCYHIHQERYDEDPYIQLKNQDLLITKDGTIGKLAVVTGLEKPACLNSGIFVVRSLNKNFSTKYLFWLLKSNIFTQFNSYTSYGSTIQHLYQNVFVEFSYPQPTFDEQNAIANYLDRKTAEIDALIAQKERLIGLYEEEKTVIINQAVTKGIDPMAKLKSSGIGWLGNIPEEWEMKKLKYLVSKVGSGVTPKGGASVYQLSGIPLLRSQNIHFDGLKLDEVAYISEETHESMANSKVQLGDVLLNITGASIGRCYFVDEKLIEANVNQHVCIIRPKEQLSTKFLYYLLRSNLGQQQIYIEQTGSGREGLNSEALNKFLVPNISLALQIAIEHYIEIETARIDTKIAKTNRIIELQKEYRTALISEVVTGKVKVSHLANKEMAS